MHEATGLRLPFNVPVFDDDDTVESMQKPYAIQVTTGAEYRKLASVLESEEKLLHDSMHHDLQTVMKTKRILLFKKMLETRALLIASFARS